MEVYEPVRLDMQVEAQRFIKAEVLSETTSGLQEKLKEGLYK